MQEMFFSDVIRKEIDNIEIGTIFTTKQLVEKLGISKKDYKRKTQRVSMMLKEKTKNGSLDKIRDGKYKKIKTVPTQMVRTTKGYEEEDIVEKKGFVIYRGVIYTSSKAFRKEFDVGYKELLNAINVGYFRKYFIFKTADNGEALCYAKKYKNAQTVDLREGEYFE